MKKTKLTLFHSVIALLLCFSMLIGTTFAWFTDSVKTGINTIAVGNLDVELYHSNAAVKDEQVDPNTKLFMDLQGDPILWEPGVVSYENLRITNEGDLALAYQLAINTENENFVVDPASGALYGLSQILKVGVVEGGITATDRAGVVASVKEANWTTLANFLRNGSLLPEGKGEFEKTWGVVIYWEPGENDNLWNLNNGKYLNEGEVLSIDLGIRLIATQDQYESDGFGSDYDSTAKEEFFPEFVGGSVTVDVATNAQHQTTAEAEMTIGNVTAVVSAGVQLTEGTTEITLSVSEMNTTGSNVQLGENEEMRSLDVHIEGVADSNTVPITVTLTEVAPTGLNMGNYKLYHVEKDGTKEMTLVDSTADFTAHNQFKYDPATGDIILHMATFSEVTLVADTVNAWEGNIAESFASGDGSEANPYIIANADQLAYLNKTVSEGEDVSKNKVYKLIADINFDGSKNENIWYPIGYWNEGKGTNKAAEGTWYTYGDAFQGVFDGTGHTISGIYQNTWAMDGNYGNGYWNEAMGLFGYVYGGTIKNLTIDNFYSEGEFAPTGVVAAYAANATFENIAITNSHPATYNTSVAAVVGRDGKNGLNNNTDGYNLIFRNITIDDTNTVSALWGSWDVGAAGLLGYLGSDSKVLFENCNVAATIDVYNDVCGNYQYYWYRYCGAFIGTVDKRLDNGQGSLDLSNVTAKNCTVNFGDRHEYYYCEFEKNTVASYTDDFQFSRVDHSELNMDVNPVTCKHTHTANEDKQAVYIPFRQLFGGYGWGVDGVDEYENIDITTIANVKKFEKNDALTGDFLYRVGNKNAFPIGKLFQEVSENIAVDSGVYVSVTPMLEGVSMEGTFVRKANWEDSTLHITGGTGLAKLTIQDYNNCEPFELIVEVVDAYNDDTSKATESDVVLLSNISSSGFTVSNGHTFYGNGFEVTCAGKGTYLNHGGMTRGYVNVESGGVLDNTQVVCDIYPQALVYTSEVKVASNLDTEASTADKSRYMYQLSAIALSGDGSTISNCYAYGGRNNIYVGGGNVRVENTVTECGTLANIQIKSTEAYTVTLVDVKTIQYQTKSPYDATKTMLGFGVLVGDNESASNPKLSIQNSLTQYNWVTNADTNVSNEYAKQAIASALTVDAYKHTHDSQTTVNTGIIYLNNKTATINDKRTDHGYVLSSVAMEMKDPNTGLSASVTAQVYSLGKDKGNYETNEDDYNATVQGDVLPTIDFNLGTQAVEGEDRYLKGDINGVEARFEEGQEAFNLDITKLLTASKHGFDLSVTATCLDSNGNALTATNGVVTLDKTGTYTLKFTVEDDIFFTPAGELLDKSVSRVYTVPIALTVAEPAIADATITITKNAPTGSYCDASLDGSKNLKINLVEVISVTDAGEAFSLTQNIASTSVAYSNKDAFNGTTTVTVNYTTGQVLTIVLAKPSSNSPGTKTVSYSNDGTLKTDGQFAKNSCTAATWMVNSYAFKGINGKTVTCGSVTFTISADTSGGGCVTQDTLVTLADGTQKRVDELSFDDKILAWDFFTGSYVEKDISLLVNHGEALYKVANLQFSDGTVLRLIAEHGVFDYDLNKFVYITVDNMQEYVGHRFVKYAADGSYSIVKLTRAYETEEYTSAWSVSSAVTSNAFASGLLTVAPPEDFYNWIEMDGKLHYDVAQFQQDVEAYGLYTYDDFKDYVTYEQFVDWNGAYLKIAVEKSYFTFDYILELIELYKGWMPNN